MALHHYQRPSIIFSVPRFARAVQHHVGLLIMVSGRSKPISPLHSHVIVLLKTVIFAPKQVVTFDPEIPHSLQSDIDAN